MSSQWLGPMKDWISQNTNVNDQGIIKFCLISYWECWLLGSRSQCSSGLQPLRSNSMPVVGPATMHIQGVLSGLGWFKNKSLWKLAWKTVGMRGRDWRGRNGSWIWSKPSYACPNFSNIKSVITKQWIQPTNKCSPYLSPRKLLILDETLKKTTLIKI